jgi:anti-anti-sigma factor
MRTGGRRESPGGCDVHDHLAWVFDDDAEWAAATTTFVAAALARHERVYYGAAGSPDDRKADLAGLPDRDSLVEKGALQIFDAGVIATAGNDQRTTLIRMAVYHALDDGYTGARFAVDSTGVAPGGDWDAQAGWECLSDRLCQSLSLTALCGVNRSVVGDEAVARIACMHPATGGCGEPAPFSLFEIAGGLALSGEVDASAADLLDRAFAHHEPGAGEAVLDLSRLGFVDARGLATLAARADQVAAVDGILLVTGASPMFRRLWELCAFDLHPGMRMVEESWT